MFFSEEKNQKTFVLFARVAASAKLATPVPAAGRKSLFASFSSEKEGLLAFAATLLLAGTAWAADPQIAPIDKLDDGLVTAMKNGSAPFASRYQALAPIVDQAFNLSQILQTTVGLRWASIPADKQKALLAAFRAFTIASYVANFNEDAGTKFRILPESRNVGADKVVETEIVPTSGDPTRMDYVMRQSPAGWQAIDVLEEGTISQAAVQRSDFRSLLADGPDKLIESLTQKVDKLSGGTVKP
jgi:phospholipid transport system substrate-binding protein